MLGDNFKLGTQAPIRESGDLEGSEAITLIGPAGEVELKQGLIVAKRHIHMSVADAENFGVTNGQIVKVKTNGERSLIFDEVVLILGVRLFFKTGVFLTNLVSSTILLISRREERVVALSPNSKCT